MSMENTQNVVSQKKRITPKFLTNLYINITKQMDKYLLPAVPKRFHPLWHSALGPKTIFFWSPVFKWGLVIAGISDLARPAETLSMSQCGSLALTGIIWSRYSLVIIPKNYGLFSVNLFVALTQLVQLGRAFNYQYQQKQLEQSENAQSVVVSTNDRSK